ncbi:MAG TPA: hypothetical protein VKT77_16100 [Chthonomonadaceae bacterium]|nr:hypothetical protein [Chthonomonadaceae bacterium]
MKWVGAVIAMAAFGALSLSAIAQKPAPGKTQPKMAPTGGKMASGKPASKGVTGTSIGKVKSAPKGNSFVLTTAKGDTTVDLSKAKVRNTSGQFVKANKITAGAPAEVTGQWKGKTLVASSVTLNALKAEKPAGGDMKKPGGKLPSPKMAPKVGGMGAPKPSATKPPKMQPGSVGLPIR